MIEIQPYRPDLSGEWRAFLEASNNGTVFHDLEFLAYHPAGKFNFHHLLFREKGALVGLMPAAIVTEPGGQRVLQSPCGASVGGIVLPCKQSVLQCIEIVAALQEYALNNGFDGIEMRLGPAIYLRELNEQLGFALASRGFGLVRRWLTSVISLPETSESALALLSRRYARYVRKELNKELMCDETESDALPAFYEMLCRDRAKFDARPTHDLPELQRLFELVPGRVRLFRCTMDSKPVAWSLIYILNERVGYVMYQCHDNAFDERRPALMLAAHLIGQCSEMGLRYLDYGPTSDDHMEMNRGLAFFKEGIGAIGFCRDTWRWLRG